MLQYKSSISLFKEMLDKKFDNIKAICYNKEHILRVYLEQYCVFKR